MYEDIISKVANSTGYSKELIDKTYKAFWKAVKEHITSLPLKQDLSDEEFLSLQPNVNIPSIGKFYVSLNRYKKLKNNSNKIKEKYGNTH